MQFGSGFTQSSRETLKTKGSIRMSSDTMSTSRFQYLLFLFIAIIIGCVYIPTMLRSERVIADLIGQTEIMKAAIEKSVVVADVGKKNNNYDKKDAAVAVEKSNLKENAAVAVEDSNLKENAAVVVEDSNDSNLKENAAAIKYLDIAFPIPSDIPHLDEMKKRGLDSSYRHHLKFFTLKDKLIPWINKPSSSTGREVNRNFLHPHKLNEFFGTILNDQYAFRHIFKSGGTTIAYQAGRKHHSRDQVGSRKIMTVVRDPIEHFLSGWAECGFRYSLHETTADDEKPDESYEMRVKSYLNVTAHCYGKDGLPISETATKGKSLCTCSKHSHSQFMYLLFNNDGNETTKIEPQLEIVGDMMELQSVAEMVGFTFERKAKIGRSSNDNDIKKKYYPKRIDLLSESTLQDLCDFVMMDYIAFDFEPPSTCRKQIRADLMNLVNH